MNKRIVAALLSATLGTALLGGVASAAQQVPAPRPAPQTRPTPPDPLLRADANKDGVVTRDEVTARLTAAFARVDADRDGKISPDERDAVHEVLNDGPRGPGGPGGWKRGPGKGRMDRGGPDRAAMATLEGQKTRAMMHFDRIDTNKDGRIDQAERTAMHAKMLAMREQRGHRGTGDMPPPPPPADAPGN